MEISHPNRTAVLLDSSRSEVYPIDWSKIGQVLTELSGLYQLARDRRIDLILVGEGRSDLVRPVAVRLRRHHGLTEIWRLAKDDVREPSEEGRDIFDGTISLDRGESGLMEKTAQILRTKDLLASYGIVARSSRMKVVAETVERIAPTDVAVLIVGPSGSGKELVARALHRNSGRRDQPFIAINCGALAEGVLESELFGHERGAFTGSVSKRDGLFRKAGGGTIFLDEIGETKPDTQVKLLRVLEDGAYYPVGSSVAQHADVRVVSATNRDLQEALAERLFREDLYFRIGVVKIILPPLLERKGDIQALLQHFWVEHPDLDYTDSGLNLLMRYDWPGNIRQLKNFADRMTALKPRGMVEVEDVERFVEEQHSSGSQLPVRTGKTVEQAGQELLYRAVLQLGNEIRMLRDLITAHLPSEPAQQPAEPMVEVHGSIDDMERALIRKALRETRGNRREAAKRLGIGERTLYRKLKKYQLR